MPQQLAQGTRRAPEQTEQGPGAGLNSNPGHVGQAWVPFPKQVSQRMSI